MARRSHNPLTMDKPTPSVQRSIARALAAQRRGSEQAERLLNCATCGRRGAHECKPVEVK